MASYRLYFLRGGRVVGEADFRAESDEAAVVHASDVRGGQAAELWQGLRKIWTFEAHDEPGADTS